MQLKKSSPWGYEVASSFFAVVIAFASLPNAMAQDATMDLDLVPQHFLGLIHAPEVHDELGLSTEQVSGLDALFDQVDGYWFRARNYPVKERRQATAQVEERVKQWMKQNTSLEQQERLQQLEYRAINSRMFLRPDVQEKLDLDASQIEVFTERARATAKALQELNIATMKNKVSEEVKQLASKAAKAEQESITKTLRVDQLQKLAPLIGAPFDTQKLKRIYPKAPELQPVQHWINSKPLQLSDLRGKVVLIHFYAFQCHNCHANFGHYNSWHGRFENDDVVVIGIQTPETSRESDPDAVRQAASERGFEFPVLIDLDKKNWDAWHNTMWPTVYVVDKKGYIRHWWQGELNYQGATGDKVILETVQQLLSEPS